MIFRELMKEMKTMRELRNDNVCSFIGACVDNNCIILLTDYCAKGRHDIFFYISTLVFCCLLLTEINKFI